MSVAIAAFRCCRSVMPAARREQLQVPLQDGRNRHAKRLRGGPSARAPPSSRPPKRSRKKYRSQTSSHRKLPYFLNLPRLRSIGNKLPSAILEADVAFRSRANPVRADEFSHHFRAIVTSDRYTLIMRLPRFSPANSPISAFGVFS